MARPGTIGQIPEPSMFTQIPTITIDNQPILANRFALTSCLSLLDQETRFAQAANNTWIDTQSDINRWVQLRSNCRLSDAQNALFVYLWDSASSALLHELNPGTLTFPEQSCTAFIAVPEINDTEPTWQLRGPGIDGHCDVGVHGVVADFVNHIIATRAYFPLGIDIVCIDSNGKCIALPRTCQISLK
jgi:alpha-D-ribose 1-methylphosphonate 5-triphosphate synthase subunit PhnH